jgi:hypothetical protein
MDAATPRACAAYRFYRLAFPDSPRDAEKINFFAPKVLEFVAV